VLGSGASSLSTRDLQDIHAGVWHAHALAETASPVLATGDAALDAQLPGGGWPLGAMTEILQPQGVHSEWRLVASALGRSGHGPVVLVGAPHAPFAPALQSQGLRAQRLLRVDVQDAAAGLWASEQALRCAQVDAVLAWLPRARSDQLRRLHMAAAAFHKLLFVMRPEQVRHDASPAALRVWVAPGADGAVRSTGLQVEIVKRKGPPLEQTLQLRARAARMAVLLHSRSGDALDRIALQA
jgi:protein ImuA